MRPRGPRAGRSRHRPAPLLEIDTKIKIPPVANDKGGTPSICDLSDFFAPGLQILLHLRHELVGNCAVNQAVIVSQSEVNDGANGNGVIAVLVGDYHGLLGDAAYTHDCGVRLVDDGESEDGAELAGIGDSESGAFDVFGLELLGAGTFPEISDAALQTEEVQIASILQHGDDESPVECYGNAHVDEAMIADVIAVNACVNDGPLLQGHHGSAHEERHEG